MRWPGDENKIASDDPSPLITNGVPVWADLWKKGNDGKVVIHYAIAPNQGCE